MEVPVNEPARWSVSKLEGFTSCGSVHVRNLETKLPEKTVLPQETILIWLLSFRSKFGVFCGTFVVLQFCIFGPSCQGTIGISGCA